MAVQYLTFIPDLLTTKDESIWTTPHLKFNALFRGQAQMADLQVRHYQGLETDPRVLTYIQPQPDPTQFNELMKPALWRYGIVLLLDTEAVTLANQLDPARDVTDPEGVMHHLGVWYLNASGILQRDVT